MSSDGEPHEVLTLVAITSGSLLAVVILIFLRCSLDCNRKYENYKIITLIIDSLIQYFFSLSLFSKLHRKLNATPIDHQYNIKENKIKFPMFAISKSFNVTMTDEPIKTISEKIDTKYESNVLYIHEKEACSPDKCFNHNCISELKIYTPGVKTIAL